MIPHLTHVRATLALACLCALSAASLARPTGALAGQPQYIETPVYSTAPDASVVSESYVSLYAPLPAADGPHPAACDRIGYLRFRDSSGPTDPARAAAVFVAQPGFYEGAGALDQVARNTVRAAAARGYHVEFWALDRRSQCLEDDLGVRAAAAARNPQLAIDYYYDGQAVDGQTFPGFVAPQDAEWLAHVGLAQTVQDEYRVISQLPRAVRERKVFCGGHSLGGIITGVFANWNFSRSGNPAAAGYNQCAGFFALDTRLTSSLTTTTLSPLVGDLLSGILQLGSESAPYINAAPFTPETSAVVPILGMASYFYPNQKSTIPSQVPNDGNFNATFRELFSSSWLNVITGEPDIRQFSVTNEAAVGLVFGDVSDPVGILRAGIGVPTGGPVVEKSFPVPYGSPPVGGGILGGNDLIALAPESATANGPLYGWLNYNRIPSPPPSPEDDPGQPYTSAKDEVSDITQLSRTLFQAPALFTEDYFPTQIVYDLLAEAEGDRSGSLAHLLYSNAYTLRPTAYIDAGDGITPNVGPIGAILPSAAPEVHVVAPGYHHLDVVTAAYQQTNGEPEITSNTLASWMSEIVGPPQAGDAR